MALILGEYQRERPVRNTSPFQHIWDRRRGSLRFAT